MKNKFEVLHSDGFYESAKWDIEIIEMMLDKSLERYESKEIDYTEFKRVIVQYLCEHSLNMARNYYESILEALKRHSWEELLVSDENKHSKYFKNKP